MAGLGSLSGFGNRLYKGEVAYEIVGRRKRWLVLFGVIALLALAGLLVRGLSFSVDFKGGSVFTVPSQTLSSSQVTSIALSDGVPAPTVQVQQVVNGGRQLTITTTTINEQTTETLTNSLAKAADVPASKITVESIGASWGHDVTVDAVEALIIFLVLLAVGLTVFYGWQMAVAALVSLINVIIITVGVYAWSGLEVSPSSMVGFLTILGYAMYDAVVVFDKIRENKKVLVDSNRMGYGRATNLAVNQTLVRSMNTSIIALIPVASLLLGGTISQAAVLQDLALAMLVGIGSGTVSSILVAAPTLVWIKELDPKVRAHAERLEAKAAQQARRAAQDQAKKDEVPQPSVETVPVEMAASVSAPPAARPAAQRKPGPGERVQPRTQSRAKRK
ncbi:MAG TPA: protein translocase subunit SecF [Actinocrinis sp.]|jgi:preprotein translocase subunit SecF